MDNPVVQIVIGVAAFVAALTVIWRWMRPILLFAGEWETTTLPLLKRLSKLFSTYPNELDVLREIADEFKTDSGSSLRDGFDRMETAIAHLRATAEVVRRDALKAAEDLRVGVETTKVLAERDRERIEKLSILLDRLTIKVDAGGATALRIEQAAEVVRTDLQESHDRADAQQGQPGEAADAASRSPEGGAR